MSYSVILSNGKSFSGLDGAGDYFKSKSPVSAEDFSGNLGRVIVSASGGEQDTSSPLMPGTYEDLELFNMFEALGEWYFCLRAKDTTERDALKDRADIEYIAMMTGVEL